MGDEPIYAFPRGGPDLQAAVRRARIEEAERSTVAAELRGAELARLEMLQEALRPVLKQVPHGIDLFDVGIVPGDKPRLFVDMIAFIETGRDRRAFRFVQDTRSGRVVIAENERIETIVEAITLYIGRRLVERERALAAEAGRGVGPIEGHTPAQASATPPSQTDPTSGVESVRSNMGAYTTGDMVFAFLVGAMAGALGLFIAGLARARGLEIGAIWPH